MNIENAPSMGLSTARGRLAIAKAMQAIGDTFGCETAIREDKVGRSVYVVITAQRSLSVMVDVSSGHRAFVMHWFFEDLTRTDKLQACFGGCNEHHWRKATHVAHGTDPAAMLEFLHTKLSMAHDGSAFRPDDEALRMDAQEKARYVDMVQRSRAQLPS